MRTRRLSPCIHSLFYRFTQADVHDFAAKLLDAVLTKIEGAGTPEKVAENDHLMKCMLGPLFFILLLMAMYGPGAMRVIVTARQTLTPVYQQVLQRLVSILGIISKNPSNPNFDQYIFESISALMRCVLKRHANDDTDASTDSSYTAPQRPCRRLNKHYLARLRSFCNKTLIVRVDPLFPFSPHPSPPEYIPYVFQILAQMLSLHTTGVPTEYRTLLPFLLTPVCWQQKGSIPGLVKLLRAFLARDAQEMVRAGQVERVLAIVQQRLVPSKMNDGWGFELLAGVVQDVDPCVCFRPFSSLRGADANG